MKRFGLAVGVVALLALGGAGVASAGTGSDRDFVTGSIKRTALNGTGVRHFTINALETGNGLTGAYRATYDPEGWEYHGKVTCLNVVGNAAYVGIEITRSTFPGVTAGMGEIIRVIDKGLPNDGDGQPDAISPGVFSATAPTTCPTPVQDSTPTFSGNVTVHDGHP